MILIHLQFCAVALTATLPNPPPTVLLNDPECQYPHTNLTNLCSIPLLVSPVDLSCSVCRPIPNGGFVIYNDNGTQLNRAYVTSVVQMAITDSRQHAWHEAVETVRVYEKDDVELLFEPELSMTWRDLEAVSYTLSFYVDHVINFNIFDKQWRQLGRGKIGFV